MQEKANQEAKKNEILELCKSDSLFAEQLYSELYIYLNYNESLVGMDMQSCGMKCEKPTWTQNFMHRIKQALQMKGIEIEFDTSEVIDLIRESSHQRGYSLQGT